MVVVRAELDFRRPSCGRIRALPAVPTTVPLVRPPLAVLVREGLVEDSGVVCEVEPDVSVDRRRAC